MENQHAIYALAGAALPLIAFLIFILFKAYEHQKKLKAQSDALFEKLEKR